MREPIRVALMVEKGQPAKVIGIIGGSGRCLDYLAPIGVSPKLRLVFIGSPQEFP